MMNFKKPTVAIMITAVCASVATVAYSQMSEGSNALMEANHNMHAAMSIEMTGDVDRDFAAAMIPHHQGAIDMAKIVLKYGKDPEIRKLAEAIVGAQESEIAFMKDWLSR